MRLWSLHPKFLDQKGLVALWRESLGAQAALAGRTKGYSNHPQLNRFKALGKQAVPAIGIYLFYIWCEATERGYNFNFEKIIDLDYYDDKISVNIGQLEFEREHLVNKLKQRDPKTLQLIKKYNLEVHPLFNIVKGGVEEWEKL